jgi:hypothetical protein
MLKNIKLIAISTSVIVSLLLGGLSISYFDQYGWTIFVLTPVLLGFLPPFIIGRKKEITLKQAHGYSFLALAVVTALLLLLAIEGLICIIMAMPFAALLVWVGSVLGYLATKSKKTNTKNITSVILICSVGFLSFDTVNKPDALIPVKTKVIINAPIETVWENVVTFDHIEEPTDWLFKTGIAYPTDATIKGQGEDAIRYCNFTTGSFVEPITKWDAPNLLQFDVVDQPAPMSEFNPFWDIHPKHLDGYFKSYKGQFKLKRISANKTELEGTTWYKVDIQPEFYWSAWSDFIIHRIHLRVLNHIKDESEKKS